MIPLVYCPECMYTVQLALVQYLNRTGVNRDVSQLAKVTISRNKISFLRPFLVSLAAAAQRTSLKLFKSY